MKRLRRWNIWSKRSTNSWIYKILVLFNIKKSPTMQFTILPEEAEEIRKAFEEGIAETKPIFFIN